MAHEQIVKLIDIIKKPDVGITITAESQNSEIVDDVKAYLGRYALQRALLILNEFDKQTQLMSDKRSSNFGGSFNLFTQTPEQTIICFKNEFAELIDKYSEFNEALKNMTMQEGEARRLMAWIPASELEQESTSGRFVM